MNIKCSTCGKEYDQVSYALACCVREEDGYLLAEADVELDKPIKYITGLFDVEGSSLVN